MWRRSTFIQETVALRSLPIEGKWRAGRARDQRRTSPARTWPQPVRNQHGAAELIGLRIHTKHLSQCEMVAVGTSTAPHEVLLIESVEAIDMSALASRSQPKSVTDLVSQHADGSPMSTCRPGQLIYKTRIVKNISPSLLQDCERIWNICFGNFEIGF